MKLLYFLLAFSWTGLWFTSDQQGQRLLHRDDFAGAARAFVDPMWRGVAWYRAGEFEKATQSFGRLSTPDSFYNLGNSWLMLGKYDKAIESYSRALDKRPNWQAAQENLDLAKARAKMTEQKGGDLGDQQEGADEVVFNKDKKSGGQETEVAGDQASSNAMVQSIWLRQVQTKPADFLKAKFAFQDAQQGEQE